MNTCSPLPPFCPTTFFERERKFSENWVGGAIFKKYGKPKGGRQRKCKGPREI